VRNNVLFEYLLPYTTNDFYCYPYYINGSKAYWQLRLKNSTTFSNSDFDVFQESVKDEDDLDEFGYQRMGQLRTCRIFGDINILKNIKFIWLASNVEGSEVYFTNEAGHRNLIQIIESPVSDPVDETNYLKITFKYKIKDSDIRLNDKQVVNLKFKQEPSPTPELTDITKQHQAFGEDINIFGQNVKL
jgi:hypothetical protein